MGGRSIGKVVAFVTRQGPTGDEVLVLDHPTAGTQVPSGTLDPYEDPLVGAVREAWEETGLDQLRLVEDLGSRVESRVGDGRGRLTTSVEVAGRRFGRGYAARVLDQRSEELLVEIDQCRGWVPVAVFAEDVVRHFFHFVNDVETPKAWWVITPDGDGLCWGCRWLPLAEAALVAGQHEWLDPVRERLRATTALQPGPRPRAPIDPQHYNATTIEVFWAPPFGGRRTLQSWLGPAEIDPADVAERALAVCFTPDDGIVLVSGDGRSLWNFPGGGREPGESITETLQREVYEEACAVVSASTLLGHHRFVEIDGAGDVVGVSHHARFAARVVLEPFVSRHETVSRTVVDAGDVAAMLPTWHLASLQRLLDIARNAVKARSPGAIR